jgi:hypothetical protein
VNLPVQIGVALPQVFRRTYPIIEPSTQMLLAVSLLRFHEIDALPIGFKASQKKRLGVFGYSCLSLLLETQPTDYGKFLELPAKKAALELATIGIDKDIESLVEIFKRTKFGFAWVESEKLGGFASLRDLLELYETGTLETNMTLGELASPIFSMPREATIRNVLKEMFKRRIRRVFIEGKKTFVTDRRIIGFLFSTSRLGRVAKNPESLLDLNLGEIEPLEPLFVRSNSSARKGAKSISDHREECLICEKGVVTPWDLIMKPLALGALKIKR